MNRKKLMLRRAVHDESSSPTCPSTTHPTFFSPITSLSMNFSEVTNIKTPVKRLSLDSNSSSIYLNSSLHNSFDSDAEYLYSNNDSSVQINDEEKENFDSSILTEHSCSPTKPSSSSFDNKIVSSSTSMAKQTPDSGCYNSENDKIDESMNDMDSYDTDPCDSSYNMGDLSALFSAPIKSALRNSNKGKSVNFASPVSNSDLSEEKVSSCDEADTSLELKTQKQRSFRRSMSLVDTTPTSSKILRKFQSIKFQQQDLICMVNKRNRPLGENIDQSFKKPRLVTESPISPLPKGRFARSHSESHLSIMNAVNLSSVQWEKGLVGDFSRQITLPVLKGRHPDLNTINNHTMVKLLKGEFKETVPLFKIIDCRYPFEFEGGHIKGAVNWYHPEIVVDSLNEHKMMLKTTPNQPNIVLIFHCEFSAERGPKYLRLLRENDRTVNEYPKLCFPEIYVLEGGYKAFYEEYPEYCLPRDYVKMIDPQFGSALRYHRSQSKLWMFDNKSVKNSIARFNSVQMEM